MADKIDWEKGTITPPAGSNNQPDWESGTITPPPKATGVFRKAADVGLSVAKGVIGVPEAAVGLADIATGGAAGKAAENIGVRFKDAKQVLTDWQSDDLKSKQQEFQQADGVVDKLGVALSNPSLIANAVGESIPLMGAGGMAARGVLGIGARGVSSAAGGVGPAIPGLLARTVGNEAAPMVAGAIGEGLAGAGSAAEQIRQETPTGDLSGWQSVMAAGSGVAATLIGAAGGALSRRFGWADPDAMQAAGTRMVATPAAARGVFRRTAEGAAAESLLEEVPQSLSEQAFQNAALGRPLTEGMADAGVMGGLAGAAMGGAAGAMSRPAPVQPPPPAAPPAADWSTTPGAAGPRRAWQQDPAGPQAPDWQTTPGAAAQPDGIDYMRDVDTGTMNVSYPPPVPLGPLARAAALVQPPVNTDPNQGSEQTATPPQYRGPLATVASYPQAAQPALPGPRALPGPADITDNGQPFRNGIQAARAAKQAGPGFRPVQVDGGFVVRRDTSDAQDVEIKQPKDTANAVQQRLPAPAAATPDSSPTGERPGTGPVSEVRGPAGAPTVQSVTGQQLDDRWTAFSPESGTKAIPRATMPQVKSEHRGALVNFLNARGITHTQVDVPAQDLKPTQAEFSPKKVQQARDFTGGDRSILVSSDGHILDGHHQWVAALESGKPVKAIRLNAPIDQLVTMTRRFPSAETAGAVPPAAPDAGAAQAGQSAQGIAPEIGPVGTPDVQPGVAPVAAVAPAPSAAADPTSEKIPESSKIPQESSAATAQYGRDGEDLAQGGKPFKTKDGAQTFRKKHRPQSRVVKVDGGYALRDKTDAEIQNDEAAGKRRMSAARAASYEKNPFLTFLAEHGLYHVAGDKKSQKTEFSPDRQISVPGYSIALFRRTGKMPDALLQPAIEDGYLPQGADESQLEDLIRKAVSGQRVAPLYAEGAVEQEMERRIEAQQEDEPDWLGPLDDADLEDVGFDQADDDLQAEVRELMSALEAQGVDYESVLEDVTSKTQNGTQNEYLQAAKQALQSLQAAQAVQPGGEGAGSPTAGTRSDETRAAAAAAEGLNAPTQQDILAQQERRENADALDERARIDREAAGQTMTAQVAPEQRKDTTIDIFGGPTVEDALAEKARKDAKAGKPPAGPSLFDEADPEPAAATAPVAAPEASPEALRAQADLNNALADLADLLGKNFRANIAPEQEAKLVPILTRVLDAAFRLGYYKFKDAARFALDTIREKIGADVADALTLEHLQGAYIAMSGKYRDKGAETVSAVAAVESLADLAPAAPTAAPAAAPPVATREGQMHLANRASRIASLKMMNEHLRKIAPGEAWADSNIESAADLDALQDQISAALVAAQRGPAAVNPLRTELEQMSGAELRAVMERMGLAGTRMTQDERVATLLAEDEAEVRSAMGTTAATHQDPGEAPEPATPAVIAESLKTAANAAAAASRTRPRDTITFPNPVTGPSGQQLVAYTWQWKPMDLVDKRGEDITVRVSNWEEAATNPETGRDVVHQFVVRAPGGDEQTVSAESAMKLLGYVDAGTAKAPTSVMSAAKTLAKWRMAQAETKALLDRFGQDEAEVKALALPAMPTEKDEKGWWNMGDASVRQIEAGPLTEERKRALIGAWRDNRMQERGWKTSGDLLAGKAREIEDALKRAERKLKEATSAAAASAPAPAEKPASKIEDFGQKLEGARKDYAATLKDAEAVDIAAEPLSKSWPEPDYDKLLAGGADPYVVAFIHAARDEVPTKPQKGWKLKGWVDSVETLRGAAKGLLDGSITREQLTSRLTLRAFDNVRSNVGSRAELYELVGHAKSLKGVTFAEHHYSLYKGQENVRKWVVEQKAKATVFGNWPRELAVADTKAEMLEQFKAKMAAESLDGDKAKAAKGQFIIYRKRNQEGAFIGKKIGREYIDLKKLPDVAAARAYLESNTADLLAALERYKDTPFERNAENRPRVGDDHRNGAAVTPEVFADTFGFRGVQFGNYVEQDRRQSDLNQTFDALMDMAAVLGVPPRALSLNGRLGLAFGARGKGGRNAPAAHYEPDTVVINLTKGNGPGSLGHEWWHAVDNYFGKEFGEGGFATDGARVDRLRAEMQAAFKAVRNATQVPTLRKRAAELDKRRTKPYWNTPLELSARAFESYLIAKLNDQSAANDYLANVVDEKVWNLSEEARATFFGGEAVETYPYPGQAELPAVRAAFDEFFKVVETREDDAGNVAMFSRAQMRRGDPTTGRELRVTEIQQAVSRLSADWLRRPDIYVIDSMDDAPGPVREEWLRQNSQGAAGSIEGFHYRGQVYLVADALVDEADVRRVLFHESIGHYGLRNAFPDLKPILAQLATMRPQLIRAKAKQYGLDLSIESDRLMAAEEVLAEISQDRPDLGWVQRAIAVIRRFLRRLGVTIGLSDNDIIHDYILPARNWVERGKAAAPSLMRGPAMAARSNAGRDPFYSALSAEVDKIGAKAMPAAGWGSALTGLVNKGAVKADEVEWSGIREWLDLQQGKVTKEAVLTYLGQNGVQVQEVTLAEPYKTGELDSLLEQWAARHPGPAADAILAGEPWNATRAIAAREGDAEVVKMIDRYDAPTKFGEYQLPGGTNYREVLLTLPEPDRLALAKKAGFTAQKTDYGWQIVNKDGEGVGSGKGDTAEDALASWASVAKNLAGGNPYRSSHWDAPNVLAHIRLNDRTDADGKRVLFVEELQSDWAQQGRKSGINRPPTAMQRAEMDAIQAKIGDGTATIEDRGRYTELAGRSDGVPAAPFIDSTDKWLTLALKRIMVMAAQEGYDRVAFVNGEQSADRYSLSKSVDSINWQDLSSELRTVQIDMQGSAYGGDIGLKVNKSGVVEMVTSGPTDLKGKNLEDVIGKAAAEKIMAEPKGNLSGDGLKIGGEGMIAFYDKIVPAAVNKLLSKVGGGKLETVQIGITDDSRYTVTRATVSGRDEWRVWDEQNDDALISTHATEAEAKTRANELNLKSNGAISGQQPGFTITPAMREKVAGGLPMFSRQGDQTDSPAFRPEQIKSAIGNRGTFDPADPNIMFSRSNIAGATTRQYSTEQQRAMRNVGFEVDQPTLKERAQALWKDAGKKLAQGIADQFAPIKDLDATAYSLLRLSKGASGAFETFLHGGKLKLSDGVYDFDEAARGGVVDSLLIPLQGEHHDFFRWVAANRAERLAREGRENLFTPQDIADLKTLADGQLAFDFTLANGPRAGQTTRSRAEAYRDSLATFNAFNKNVLDLAEQSGLIDGESRHLWEHEFYVPFYRVADEDGSIRGANIKTGVIRQEAFKKLKGGGQALNMDLLDNTLLNWAHLLDAAAKNRGAKATLEAAQRMGVAIEANETVARQIGTATGNKQGVVWFMDDGLKRYFVVDDPYVLAALTSLEYAGMRNPVMDAMGAFKHALTVGVTASPFFKIRNLIRDSVQVIGTSSIGVNPAANVAQGWKLTDPKSDAYFRLLAGGGTIHFGTMLEGSEAKRVQALVESGVDSATILNSQDKVKAFYRKYIEPGITAYNELGNRGEAVNRAALYQQLRAQGMDHAQASLAARDLMDFSMQGTFTSIRFLTQVVPFFNARIQGMYKLGRAAKEDPARMSAVIGATALFSIALLAAYGDDDDWKKREEWDRNNYWWFKFGDTAFRIPKPFEIGAMATLAERSWELAFDEEMTGKRFRKQIQTLLADNLSMNPIPQLIKPVIDVYANKDSFTGRPIETMDMERLRADYRFTDRTSMFARGVSTAMNAATGTIGAEGLSPVQVDHMLRGYFGWLGAFIVGAGDTIARPATDQPTHPAPDYWKTVTGGMASDLRDAPSRYVSQMYEQAREIEKAYGTWKMLLREGKVDEAREFRADNAELLNEHKQVERVKKAESALNQRARMIERSNMDQDRKRELLRQINEQKDRTARLAS